MITSCDSEPDINIHITGAAPRSVKRASATQKNKRAPPKKPRLTPLSINSSNSNLKNTETDAVTTQHRTSDVSFRHLFSFASQSDGQQREGNSAQDTKQGFAFLRENDEVEQREMVDVNESQFPGPSTDSFRVKIRQTHPETGQSHNTPVSPKTSHPLNGREPLDHCKPYRGIGDATGPSQFLHWSNDSHFQDHKIEAERRPSSDILMIPEDIDARPDEILRIATRFCRQKSVEQLEEDWCAPGGIRETMRRDFKQKRQSVTRSRKLGSSGKR